VEKAPVSDLLTTGEVAEQLRTSRQTVGNWIRRGWLRAYRAGGRWLVDPKDLEAFVKPPSET
jgi:excisionase family DNA binding protein